MTRAVHALRMFHPATADWFRGAFPRATAAQVHGWESISDGQSTLIFAPTGSGKTLAAFLWCLDRVMFGPAAARAGCRVLYVSPLKALAVDVERNLRQPLAGIAQSAERMGAPCRMPTVMVRTGDTPAAERAAFQRHPADILVTTPESLYLLLTSNARLALSSVETVIVDEIHALVPTKRGAHLALSIERLVAHAGRPLQRIGLSATQRPLDEVAYFLGGLERDAPSKPSRSAQRGPRGDGLRTPKQARPRAARGLASIRTTPGMTMVSASSVREQASQALDREFEAEPGAAPRYRPVTIVDARARKALDLRIEVPVDDMTDLGAADVAPGASVDGAAKAKPTSIWPAIHPRLLALVREHTSTLMFVNGRRTAERLAAALNELAGEPLVKAHHGSLARPQRVEVEEQLKRGELRGLVATSSLELGIDMGAIDLVIQIEAPPSVASGLQRIGRGGHHVNATSRGIFFPKYRGDLLACAAATRAMEEGQVEATRYPRNPLDVLAQQIVAMVAMDDWNVDELFDTVRCAANYAQLARGTYDGVLDMLSGRYPSDDFAELRPRLTWDRATGTLTAREGARRIAVANGGTIPDRGLYGVFLAGAPAGASRVGELDEEMVFESVVGETFLLGASTWRIESISHDRVVVSPAPGEPGKMPFWKGDRAGRPLEFGRAIGALTRTLSKMPREAARALLESRHGLDRRASDNLVAYLEAQREATGVAPDDRTVVVERYRDDFGDWRMCVLTPFGGQVLAPWALAAAAKVRESNGVDPDVLWGDDGLVLRLPDTETPPDVSLVVPDPAEAEGLLLRQLGSSALFAAKFRECAGRALLLPRRRPGGRTPLWQQRRRASDLLTVAAQFASFPIVLEAYRECLRDTFDVPALISTLRGLAEGHLRVVCVDRTSPSPFAAALLFGYVANFMYEGDAPLPERRAQALTIDQTHLRELLGDASLRELLDMDAVQTTARELQGLSTARARSADALHDLLLRLGDLSMDEIERRVEKGAARGIIDTLTRARRAVWVSIAAQRRLIAVEDVGRYRDALGIEVPSGLPSAWLEPTSGGWTDLVRRFARTHPPFSTDQVVTRFGVERALVEATLRQLVAERRVVEGELTPGAVGREWCDTRVLATIRRRSLARLRQQVEPVEPHVLGRLLTTWQGVVRPRAGLDALLDAIERVQAAPLPASLIEREILPARVAGYAPSDLDTLLAAGEVVWTGAGSLGEHDGRIRLFLADRARTLLVPPDVGASGPRAAPIGRQIMSGRDAQLARADSSRDHVRRPRVLRGGQGGPRLADGRVPAPPSDQGSWGARERAILAHLERAGASFFDALHEAAGGGFPQDSVNALWSLVWQGYLTNDTFHALRALTRPSRRARATHASGRAFRSRQTIPPEVAGRWSLVSARVGGGSSPPAWSAATAQSLLDRCGIVTREVAHAESLTGGFSSVYEVLRTLEERGSVQRGYFVSDVGATQFATPAALELLRALRSPAESAEIVVLAAVDPANPFGTLLPWPTRLADVAVGRGPSRVSGASVVLVDGALAGYVARSRRQLLVYLPDDEPERGRVSVALAAALWQLAVPTGSDKGLLISEIDGEPAVGHTFGPALLRAGFAKSALGYQRLRTTLPDAISD